MTKTAIVTGGDGDIGKAIARGLREIDRDVATVDGTETVHKTAADLGARAFRCDITDRASRTDVVDLPPLDWSTFRFRKEATNSGMRMRTCDKVYTA